MLCVGALGFCILESVIIITRRLGMHSKKSKLDDMEQTGYHDIL